MAFVQTEPPPPEPTPAARKRSGLFIGAFVLLQVFVPLSYLARDDAADDRFTWKTLSAPEQPACETRLTLERLGGEHVPIAIQSQLPEDWLRHLQRGRKVVVDAFLSKQCEEKGVEEVELLNRCEDDHETRRYVLRCGAGVAYETTRTAAR